MDLRTQLQAVYEQHGKLTPKLVVDEARDPNHALHNRFEWDDEIAGEKYRQHQAHKLIQVAYATYERGEELRRVRAYHAIPSEDSPQPSYEPVDKVKEDPFMRQLVLRNAQREWKALKARYGDLEEFLMMVRGDVDSDAA